MNWQDEHQLEREEMARMPKKSDKYPEGFFHWLQFNDHIWHQFEIHANTMARKRLHYSARTIIEVMRWNSDLREQGSAQIPPPLFKMSNNMTPGLARLWMANHGRKYPKFFSIQR